MANKGSLARRAPRRRRMHRHQRDPASQRAAINPTDVPNVSPEAGETVSSIPSSSKPQETDNTKKAGAAAISRDEHSKVKKNVQGEADTSKTGSVDISPWTEERSSGNQVAQAGQKVVGENLLTTGSIGKTHPSRKRSLFPKPPTCRTIHVSRGKSSMNFYFRLARRFLKENLLIELSGMGMACALVIQLYDLILEKQYAEKDHIHVSMTKESEGDTGTEPKARIQIWMRRTDHFFALVSKSQGNGRSGQENEEGSPVASFDDARGTSCFRSSKVSEKATGLPLAAAQICAIHTADSFQTDPESATSQKPEDEIFLDGHTLGKKGAKEIATDEKKEKGKGDSNASNGRKNYDGKLELGKADPKSERWKSGNGNADHREAVEGKYGYEQAGDGRLANGATNITETFLERGARNIPIGDPTFRTTASAEINSTDAPTTRTKSISSPRDTTNGSRFRCSGAAASDSSSQDDMASRHSLCGNTYPCTTTDVGRSRKPTTHRINSGGSPTNGGSSSGFASNPMGGLPAGSLETGSYMNSPSKTSIRNSVPNKTGENAVTKTSRAKPKFKTGKNSAVTSSGCAEALTGGDEKGPTALKL